MSELTPASSNFGFATNSLPSPVTHTETIFAGRCRLKTVFLIDVSLSIDAGVEAYMELRNGSDTGDVLFKMKPTMTPGYYTLWNAQALSVELPGNGILFPDGMYMVLGLPAETGSATRGIRATVLYA